MKFAPVKTAVIGCGMISDTYLENLTKTFSIIDVVGCADLVEEKAARQAEKYKIRKMTDEEILADPSIELVVNLTYPSAHYEVNRQVLEAGKHLYCEKMMADTVEQARELLELSREKHLHFAAAPDTVLGGSMQTCRYFMDLGLIGEPVMAVVRLARNYQMIKEDRDDAVRKYSVMTRGGGIPYDMGGYYLHTLFNILGPVRRVCGFSCTHNPTRPYLNPRHSKFNEPYTVDTENTICGALEFKSGVHATMAITSECCGGEDNAFEIHGTNGSLLLGDPNLFSGKIYYRKAGAELLEFPITHPYGNGSFRGIGAADMAWAIRCGRPHRLCAEMGFHALEVQRGILDSAQDGRFRTMTADFERPAPISPVNFGGTSEERSLFLYEQNA